MFKFPLEAVLLIRQRKMEEAQLALAVEQRREMEQRQAVVRLTEEQRLSRIEFNRAAEVGVAADKYLLMKWHLDGLGHKIVSTNQKLEETKARVANRRRSLLGAERDKKMVETLKERSLLAYQRELRHREAGQLDEFAVLGFSRSGKEE